MQNNSRRSKTVAGKFKSSAERWTFRRKFEIAAEELKNRTEKSNCRRKSAAPAENSNLRLERERLRRKFEFSRENLNCQQIVGGAAGKLKSSAGKEKVLLENRNSRRKIQIVS